MSQTVVITGGSKGIGWELVQAFAGEGFNVVSGSRTIRSDVPEKIANRVKQVEIDVKNKKDHYMLVAEANNWSGSLDCYINNAGYSEWRELKNIDENFLMYDMRLKELLTRLDYQNSNIKKLEFLNLNDIDTTIIGSTNTQTFECDNVRTRCRCFNKEFQLPSQEQLDNQGLIVPPVNLRSALKTG